MSSFSDGMILYFSIKRDILDSKLAQKTFSNDFVNFFSEFRRQESLIEHGLITDIEKKHLLEFS